MGKRTMTCDFCKQQKRCKAFHNWVEWGEIEVIESTLHLCGDCEKE